MAALFGRKQKEPRPAFYTLEALREYLRGEMRKQMERETLTGLPGKEREKYRLQIRQLRKALRGCVYGDNGEKEYVKAHPVNASVVKKNDAASYCEYCGTYMVRDNNPKCPACGAVKKL